MTSLYGASEKVSLALSALALAFTLGACSDDRASRPGIDDLCFDGDDDGYGYGCAAGADCNDTDPSVHTDCGDCATPETGCACEPGSEPVDCVDSAAKLSDSSLLCTTGKRYCRDGAWTECTSLTQFTLTAEAALRHVPARRKQGPVRKQSMDAGVDAGADGGAGGAGANQVECSVCEPSCFVVDSETNTVVGGDSGLVLRDGGVSVELNPVDANLPDPPDGCPYYNDTDCDGVPDDYDEYPDGAPIESNYDTIFMQLGPGTSDTRRGLEIEFFLNQADIYFLVDMTGSMSEERAQLIEDLTSGSFLTGEAASEDCVDNDLIDPSDINDRKDQGIAGNIACLVRDAYLGAGWFRDVPFSRDRGRGGPDPFFIYGNEQDLTPDVETVLTGLERFRTEGNSDWPEGHIHALHSVVTGEQVYTGWDHPGIPPRRGCPDGTWGWPCFREEAVPVIILISDASMTNGPPLTERLYGNSDPEELRFDHWTYGSSSHHDLYLDSSEWDEARQGSEGRYVAVYPYTNEDFASAADLDALEDDSGTPFGSMDGKYITFTGDTSGMGTDIDASSLGCGSRDLGTGPDAVFRFSLDAPENVTFSAQGTRFDARMAVIREKRVTQDTETASGNDLLADAWALNGGAAFASQFNLLTSGSSAGFAGEYPWSSIGADCRSGSSDTAPDAVFRFTASASEALEFAVGGASAPMALALFDAAPVAPDTLILPNDASMDELGANTTALSVDGAYYRLLDGDTSAPAIDHDYDVALMQAMGCSAASGTSADAVIDFTVASDGTEVEFVTGGNGLSGPAGFDHVVALVRRSGSSSVGPTASPIVGAIDEDSTTPIDEGDMVDAWLRFTDTLDDSKEDTYDQDELGADQCNPHDDAYDAVYEFTLTERRQVDISASGDFGPYVSLHEGGVGCSGGGGGGSAPAPIDFALSGNENEAADTVHGAFDLGTLDAVTVATVEGDTDDRDISADYTGYGSMQDCVPVGQYSYARDQVFQFTLAATRNLEFEIESDDDPVAIAIFDSLASDDSYSELECENGGYYTTARIDARDYPAGTYYLVVKAGEPEEHCRGPAWRRTCSWEEDGDDYTFTITNNDPGGGGGGGGASCSNDLSESSVDATGDDHDRSNNAFAIGDLYGVTNLELHGETERNSSYGDGGSDPASCGDGGREQWYTFTVSSDTTLRFSTSNRENQDMDVTLSVFEDDVDPWDQVGCDEDSGDNPWHASDLTVDVEAGHTYYLLFQGANDEGDFIVDINDVANAGGSSLVACAEGAGGASDRIIETLDPGTYYVVVSSGAVETGDYTLDIKTGTAVANLGGEMLTCNPGGIGDGESSFSETLQAGDYSIIVRGADTADEGTFDVSIRDTSATGTAESLACHGAQLNGSDDSFTYSVTAGQTYYLVARGEEADDTGSYELNVWNAEVGSQQSTRACVQSYRDGQPETTLSLDAGEYYVVLKGEDANEEGLYQLTIGDESLESTLEMDPPTYLGSDRTGTTDGVLKELNDRSVRVLSVLSGYNRYYWDEEAYDQMRTLSTDTDGVDTSGDPLTYRIGHDGSGMGEDVIRAVQELVGSLEMDVTLVLNQGDDPPPVPGFTFTLTATDPGTNYGCDGVIDSPSLGDADSIPDTHVSCVPGAAPSFDVTFENPAGAPVPRNDDDPHGGYHMTLDIIGDGRYYLASIPVYIIPEDAPVSEVDEPAVATFTEQTLASECVATEGPDWSGLSWTASLPVDTQLTFRMCTAATEEELETCTPRTVATVTSDGRPCASHTDCTLGICNGGRCHYPVSDEDECVDDVDCGTNGTCTDDNTCVWSGLPLDPDAALTPGMQGLPYARLDVEIQSNDDQTAAPTLYDYQLRYECTPFQ